MQGIRQRVTWLRVMNKVMYSGGLIILREALEQLKPSERVAAEYILANPEKVIHLSIQKLALYCGVSEATIIRLARNLKMKGFKEMKFRIMGDLANKPMDEQYYDIKMDGDTQSMIQAVSRNNQQSIEDTALVLSAVEVEKAVGFLSNARRIAVYGMGASAVIAEDIKQKLTRIGWWCDAYADNHSQLTSATLLTSEDVAFGISYSGETTEIVDTLTEARKRGAKVISLTKYGPSRIAALSDVHLHTSSIEKSIRSGAMASRIAQLTVVDVLFVALASRKQNDIIPLLEKTRIIIRNKKQN